MKNKNKCSSCLKKIEENSGYYNTPSGNFCTPCHEGNEVLKYEQFTRNTIHAPERFSLIGENKSIEVHGILEFY